MQQRQAELTDALETISEALQDPNEVLVVQISEEEQLQGGRTGLITLLRHLRRRGLLTKACGRLDLELLGFEGDRQPIAEHPVRRRWLVNTQAQLPWLAAWLATEPPQGVATAFHLVGARAPWRFEEGFAVLGAEQFGVLHQIGGVAQSWGDHLGADGHVLVQPFLGLFALGTLPRRVLQQATTPELDDDGLALVVK